MKKAVLMIFCAVMLIAAAAIPAFAISNSNEINIHSPHTLPDVTEEMLTADYWVSATPGSEDIVMTPDEIKAFNKMNRDQLVLFPNQFGKKNPLISNYYEKLGIGLYMNPILPHELPETIPGDSLRTWLNDNITYLNSREFYDTRNITWSEQQKVDIIANMDVGSVPNVITRRFAIVIARGDMRLYPTYHAGYSDLNWALDFFQTTAVYSAAPAAVLHRTKSGDYYYVQTAYARGWMAAESLAFTDRKTAAKIAEDKEFLMCAEDQITIYSDPKFENFLRVFTMSEKLPLKKLSGNSIIAKVPIKKANGKLGFMNGYIKPGSDVHKGYLPFSKANVYRQFFKLLDAPYGWGDQYRKRDCSGTQRVVLYSFGIEVGRWPNFVLLAPEHKTYMDPGMSTEDKVEVVRKLEGGITWCGTGGHLVFYLGEAKNGKLYFFHQGGWGYDEGNTHYYVNRASVNEVHHSWYHIDTPRIFSTFRK